MGGTGTMTSAAGTELVLVGADNGVVVVTSDTPLKRLNYFDGKFLRAEDMQAEQDYLRFLVQLSNRAGGSGVVNGFDTALAPGGAAVSVGQGLALDALGRVLLLPIAKTMALDDLIAASGAGQGTLATGAAGAADFGDCVVVTPPAAVTAGQSGDLYLLTVGFLEALCGEEDVFGQICDDACVQSKDRRWRMEGVVFRAVPLTLTTPLKVATSVAVDPGQLRNRVAAAFFQDERNRVPSLVSGTGIRESATWCKGALAEIGDAVPLAVFARSGGVTKFLDAWTARRERMEPPPRRYWAWRLGMRPREAFLAQVLQFQCQLHDLLTGAAGGGAGGGDPCAPKTAAIGRAADLLAQVEAWHAKVAAVLTPARLDGAGVQPLDLTALQGLRGDLARLSAPGGAATDRILVAGGFLDLPPAGFLPVEASGKVTVDQQVRAYMGPGVDLRYCIVTPDYVPHALEMRQHMERISLTDGIDDPTARPKVDVLVPGGRIVQDPTAGGGIAFQASVHDLSLLSQSVLGAASGARRGESGGSFTLAGTASQLQLEKAVAGLKAMASRGPAPAPAAVPAPAAIDPAHLALARRMAARSPVAGAPGSDRPALHPLSQLSAARDLLGALEISAAVDADPFQLDVSGSTGVTLDVMLGIKAAASALIRATGGVTVFPSSKGTSPQGVDFQVGTLSGSFVLKDVGALSGGHDVAWQYQLLRQVGAGTGTVFVRIIGPATAVRSWEIEAWYTWSGDPLQGTLKIFRLDGAVVARRAVAVEAANRAHFVTELPDPPTTQPDLEIDLGKDPAVLDPTEQHHVLAESALQVLAALLPNGADWQKATEAALFPRPPAGAGNVSVLGERDWVLFARRRISACADEVVTPTPPNRHYHVYAHEAPTDRDAAAWIKALLGAQGATLQDARFLGFVDFDAATADPVDAAGLRTELDPVKGDALRWVATGSDYGDGVAEEGRRRAHLEQAVGSVLDVGAASPVDLPGLPAALQGRIDGGQTVHGAVILVTVPTLAVANVYGISAEMAAVVLLSRATDGTLAVRDPPDMGRLPPAVRAKLLLGSVSFRNGVADDAQLQAVAARWKAQELTLANAVVVTQQPADDGQAQREEEVIAAAAAPALTPQVWHSHLTQAQGFDAAPAQVDAMVFLVAGQLVRLRSDVAPPPQQVLLVTRDGVSTVRPLLDQGSVHQVLGQQARFLQPVDGLTFGPGTGPLQNPDLLRKAWRAAGEGQAQGLLSLVQGGGGGARQVRAQARSVAAAVAGTGAGPSVAVVEVTDAPAGSPSAVFHFVLPKG